MPPKPLAFLDIAADDFREDFAQLVELPSEAIDRLATYVNDERGIGFKSEADALQAIQDLELSPKSLRAVVQVAKFIFDKAAEEGVDLDMVVGRLREYAERIGITDFDAKADNLRHLLAIDPRYRELKQVWEYFASTIPLLSSVVGVEDVRAIFRTPDAIDCLGFKPLSVMKLSIMRGEEKDEIVFQTDEKGIDILIERLQSHRRRLTSIAETLQAAGLTVFTAPELPLTVQSSVGGRRDVEQSADEGTK